MRESAEQLALSRAGLRGAEDLFAERPASRCTTGGPWLALNLVDGVSGLSRHLAVRGSRLRASSWRSPHSCRSSPASAAIRATRPWRSSSAPWRWTSFASTHAPTGAQGAHRQSGERPDVGRDHRRTCLRPLSQYRAQRRDDDARCVLNLIVAAVTGIAVPLLLHRARRDPAQGASVVLTFVTDSMGFFLFLDLARLLLH